MKPFRDHRSEGRLWLGFSFRLGCFALVVRSSVFDGVSFDPFALKQDGLTAPEVDVGRGQVLRAFMVASVIVVIDGSSAE